MKNPNLSGKPGPVQYPPRHTPPRKTMKSLDTFRVILLGQVPGVHTICSILVKR